ncbi:MAG: phenylalanine--tRNA ligase subunit alpha [Chloroflexi bacterium]|nr:phenylalanine--tRNA ligase subunit alpha [Chloroflexota bacterium]
MIEPTILQELEDIQQKALDALQPVQDEAGLQAWRTVHLGRSAPVMLVFSSLPKLDKDLRPQVGQRANQVKQALEAAFATRNETLRQTSLQRALTQERVDTSLPGRLPIHGRLQPMTQILREIYAIFAEMGFQVFQSRDIELDEYNFELLNIPPFHAARDMQATFYTSIPGVVPRTHTSPGQMHAMRQFAPEPVRVVLPGMCYRFEQTNVRYDVQFQQVEVLAVGRHITLGDMLGTLEGFARRMFGDSVHIRLRPAYFPFTEPSGEMDVECFLCGGKGCFICKGSGWLEIMGCGMVHPTVLQNGGYDPRQFTGFAAGMGPGRVAMLRYHIEDIRYLYANDIRFLEQF